MEQLWSTAIGRESGGRRFAQLVTLAVFLFVGCRRDRAAVAIGVTVAEVGSGGAAQRAGVAPGDVLLEWELEDPEGGARRGRFGDAFDVAEVEAEEGPRGAVRLRGHRRGAPGSWTLAAGEWKLVPRAGTRTDAEKLEGRLARIRRGDAEAASSESAVASTLAAGPAPPAVWALLRIGDEAAKAGFDADSLRAFEAARRLAREARVPVLEARGWEAQGAAALRGNAFLRAQSAFAEALQIREAAAAGEDTLTLALARARLAHAAYSRGDLDTAEDLWTRALRTRERLAPRSLPTASGLNGLGAVNGSRGRLDAAFAFYQRALAIREALAPASIDLGKTLSNVGYVARNRGDFAAAEHFYRRALGVFESVAPDGADVATALIHLGVLALNRGDAEGAEAYLRRALAIHEHKDPNSSWVSACLNNLGEVHEARGRPDRAETSYRRALAISSKNAPDSVEVAANLGNLGRLAAAAGRGAEARALLERSLSISARLAPHSLLAANTFGNLGDLALAEKQYSRARTLHAEALAIHHRLAPRSAKEAESHYALGRILRAEKRPREALAHWLEAIQALEDQRGRLAESEHTKTAFGARYSRVFTDAVELLVERGQGEAAFHLLERSRARSFLAMLGERDLVFAADDVPEPLRNEQRQAHAAYDAAQAQLARLQPGPDDAEIDKQLAALENLRHRRATAAAAIQRASPRLGSLQQPQPLDVGGARRALDPGTLLLSYSVGENRTLLFAVLAGDGPRSEAPLRVEQLPFGRETLRRRVETFRGLLDRGRTAPEVEPVLIAHARQLEGDLLGSVRPWIASARRLLVLPDGPLHSLPFAALVEPGVPIRYLVESKAVHVAASATVYAEIRKPRPRDAVRGTPSLVAFGDPIYGEAPTTWVVARARPLPPLPATRVEVDAIAALYPGAVRYLGADATEARAMALGAGPRLIHFAAHGVLDPRFPLDSGLALSPPAQPGTGGDNGLLQAWEVFERLRLDADLVALSACDTGLGRDMGGEGLVGLSRAFQYAGARSVLASLWAVSDRSTAELMTSFYQSLKQGLTKDEALRAAQIASRHRSASAHPFHWAAFQLAGRWD